MQAVVVGAALFSVLASGVIAAAPIAPAEAAGIADTSMLATHATEPTAPAPLNPQPDPATDSTRDPAATNTADGMSFEVAGANSSPKKVFAHYFPPYPVSFDNLDPDADYYARNYLKPLGEGGKHAAYGGLLRDRPEGRSSLSGDWKEQDFLDEVNDAADAGIDGFTIDIMTTSGQNWDRTLGLMDAAASADRDFTIVPNLDASAGIRSAAPADIAAKLAVLYSSPAAHRLPTGEYVLSSFLAESQTTAWWSEIINRLDNTHGITVKFIAVMNDASDANLERFAPISYAMSIWGARTPLTVASAPNRAAKAHALGVKWMAPVAVQDIRPRGGKYAEAGNTETLRASWGRAISDGADFVQVVTWNDYSETTSFAPSEAHGEAFLDLGAYFATQFKTGAAPEITADSLYLTHRVHPYAAVPTTSMRLLSPTLDGSMAPRDTVEVVTLLTEPARITVNVGGTRHDFDAPAGFSASTFPLAVGTVSASAVRGSSTVLSVDSPFRVVGTPVVQDLQYYAVSSRVD